MKACTNCGKENEVAVAVCAECGADFFKATLEISTALQSEVSAKNGARLGEVLSDPVRLFRALVVLSTITYATWFFQLLVAGGLISQDTWDALSWHGFGALLPLPPAFSWLFFLLFIAVAVGLWTFSKSARIVFTSLSAFLLIMLPFGGLQVQTGFGSFLQLITNMADGAILVMAYTAPLKVRFE
jgi:hypothetical protein